MFSEVADADVDDDEDDVLNGTVRSSFGAVECNRLREDCVLCFLLLRQVDDALHSCLVCFVLMLLTMPLSSDSTRAGFIMVDILASTLTRSVGEDDSRNGKGRWMTTKVNTYCL